MKIIYERGENESPAVMVISGRYASGNLEEMAAKKVPMNKRFLIVDDSDLPDAEFSDAWRVDFTNATGRGTKQ